MKAGRALLSVALLLVLSLGSARAENVENWVDLGPAATTGQEAVSGVDARGRKLHLTMACGNEFEFLRGYAFATRFGKKGDDPATPDFNESGLAAWPVALMLGKAAVLRDSTIEPEASRVGRPICRHRLGTPDEVRDRWAPLASDKMMRDGETPVQLVNRIYGELFTASGNSIRLACGDVASLQGGGGGDPRARTRSPEAIYVSLTRACMSRRTAFASVEAFVARVRERNGAHSGDWAEQDADDEITYVTTGGNELKFTPQDEEFGADRRACGVVNSNGASRFTISDVPASQAANCAPVGRRIRINLEDEEHPVRQAEEGAPLDDLF